MVQTRRFLESWRWVVSFSISGPFRGDSVAGGRRGGSGAYGGVGAVRSGLGAALDAVALHGPLKVELLAVELVRHALVADAARGPPGPAAAAEPPAAQKEEDDGRRAEGQCRDRAETPIPLPPESVATRIFL